MLTGQAKIDYQREYMRKRRSNAKPVLDPELVRPITLDPELVKPVKHKPCPPGVNPNVWACQQSKSKQEAN